MKTLLLLGGSAQQVVAIETAKRLGYRTVLCDFLPDNPGQYTADKFYLVSTTDREAVLEVAKKENADGVLAYASDPAAPTAAYVAETLGLPTNPCNAVETLCNKDRFRDFLRENGFNTPVSKGYRNAEVVKADIPMFRLPVIVKPVDSSGSKGVTVLRSWDGLDKALAFAFSFSRAHRIVVEEFIEKKHPYLIGGDIFVSDGKVVLWGLLNCHRDERVNPLVPVGKSYPLLLEKDDVRHVQETLQNMIDKLGIRFGSMNVELVIDSSNRVWPIDIGPRAGGNMIPDLLGMIFGVDLVEMAIQTAMGEALTGNIGSGSGYFATYNLHSTRGGIYKQILFSNELKSYLKRICLYKKSGERVERFDNASKCLGIIFMEFPHAGVANRIMDNIEKYIDVQLME